jgi:beta-galactosidase
VLHAQEIRTEIVKVLPSGESLLIMPKSFHELSDKFISPHTVWAKPLAGGPISVLAIAGRFQQRTTIDLAQSLSLDYRMLVIPTEKEKTAIEGCDDATTVAKAEKLLAADYDVIFLNMSLTNLPGAIQKMVIDKIEGGTSLVTNAFDVNLTNGTMKKWFSGSNDDAAVEYILHGLPMKPSDISEEIKPDPSRLDEMKCLRTGKARLVALHSYRLNSYRQDHDRYNMTTPLIRSIIWAAGRDPKARIVHIDLPDKISAVEFAKEPMKLDLSSNAKRILSCQWKVSLRKRSEKSEFTIENQLQIAPGESSVNITLPRLPGGERFLDMWLMEDGKVLDWFSAYVTIEPSATVSDIDLSKPSFAAGEKVSGKVTVEGKLTKGTRLEISLIDSLDRDLSRIEIPVRQKLSTVPFSFTFVQPVAVQHRVVAKLRDDQGVIHERQQVFAQADVMKFDDFLCFAWVGENASEYSTEAHRAYDVGFDIEYFGPRKGSFSLDWDKNPLAYWTTRAGLKPFYYATYIGPWRGSDPGDEKIRVPCLSDPKVINSHAYNVTELAKIGPHMGAVGYSTGDEYWLAKMERDLCWSPTCLASLRQWLKDKYGTLEKLNGVWQKSFGSWDKVEPETLKQAKASGNFAPWTDGRLHSETVYANIHRACREAVEKYHPGAPVGEEGMGWSDTYRGNNLELFREATTLIHGYDRPYQHESIRSLAPDNAVTGYWFGCYPPRDMWESKMRWHPWHTLFNGYTGMWWYSLGFGYPLNPGGFSPDLTPAPHLAWTMEEARQIKRGPGKLLRNSERLHNGIAILYSMNSIRAVYRVPEWKDTHWAKYYHHVPMAPVTSGHGWNLLLEDIGLQYEYITSTDVEKGLLDKGEFKGLILPSSISLTKREASAIGKFVSGGGSVIADHRPGVFNALANPVEPGLLDDIFGIERPQGLQPHVKRDVSISSESGTQQLAGVWVDSAVKVTSGKSQAGDAAFPVVIRNQDGRATLLNFPMGYYHDCYVGPGTASPIQRNTATGTTLRKIVGDVLADAGIHPRIRVQDSKGQTLTGLESVFFAKGDNNYLGLIYTPDIIDFLEGDLNWQVKHLEPQPDRTPKPITITLVKARHIYDVRQKRYLGKTNRFHTKIAPGQALLYSLLPYRVESIHLESPNEAKPGELAEFNVSAQTKSKAAGLHCFRVDVRSPDGKAIKEYGQNVLGKNGKAQFTIPFALNDKLGVWLVTVTDVASGETAVSQINLSVR